MPHTTTILPPLDVGPERCRHGNLIGTKDYGKRLICDICEQARQTAMVMTTPNNQGHKFKGLQADAMWMDEAGEAPKQPVAQKISTA